MIPIEQTLVTLPMAIALGLVFGMSACTITCLPYLGPVFLASDGGIRHAWRTLLPFSLGRLAAYATLATGAGMAGQYLGKAAGGGEVRWVLGAAAVLVGMALLLRRRGGDACRSGGGEAVITRGGRSGPQRALMPGGLFLMGAGMALSPCAPLGTVLFSAAAVGSAWHGLALGLGFGLGAIAIPSLFYGVGVAYLGSRLRERLQQWRPRIEQFSALLLILVGTRNLFA
ncbi:MAG: sulfite exporter TauE/SafE family protein [Gammaproteobacteria bacterium]|nr:sulfite exporter TauE/SafE family protein [Gammaproteobacteria bacterium]